MNLNIDMNMSKYSSRHRGKNIYIYISKSKFGHRYKHMHTYIHTYDYKDVGFLYPYKYLSTCIHKHWATLQEQFSIFEALTKGLIDVTAIVLCTVIQVLVSWLFVFSPCIS